MHLWVMTEDLLAQVNNLGVWACVQNVCRPRLFHFSTALIHFATFVRGYFCQFEKFLESSLYFWHNASNWLALIHFKINKYQLNPLSKFRGILHMGDWLFGTYRQRVEVRGRLLVDSRCRIVPASALFYAWRLPQFCPFPWRESPNKIWDPLPIQNHPCCQTWWDLVR